MCDTLRSARGDGAKNSGKCPQQATGWALSLCITILIRILMLILIQFNFFLSKSAIDLEL